MASGKETGRMRGLTWGECLDLFPRIRMWHEIGWWAVDGNSSCMGSKKGLKKKNWSPKWIVLNCWQTDDHLGPICAGTKTTRIPKWNQICAETLSMTSSRLLLQAQGWKTTSCFVSCFWSSMSFSEMAPYLLLSRRITIELLERNEKQDSIYFRSILVKLSCPSPGVVLFRPQKLTEEK